MRSPRTRPTNPAQRQAQQRRRAAIGVGVGVGVAVSRRNRRRQAQQQPQQHPQQPVNQNQGGGNNSGMGMGIAALAVGGGLLLWGIIASITWLMIAGGILLGLGVLGTLVMYSRRRSAATQENFDTQQDQQGNFQTVQESPQPPQTPAGRCTGCGNSVLSGAFCASCGTKVG